jgi:hypothetical protein
MTEDAVVPCRLGLVVLELGATIQILEDEGIGLIPDKAVASRNTVIHDREDFTLAISRG